MFFIDKHLRKYDERDPRILHQHPFHELFYCIQGQGVELREAGERLFGERQLFFYPEGLAHNTCGAEGERYVCYVMSFDEDLFYDLRPEAETWYALKRLIKHVARQEDARFALRPEALPGVAEILDRLFQMQREGKGAKSWKRLLVEQLLLSLDEGLRKQPEQRRSAAELIDEVCDYVRVNHQNELSVDDVLRFCPLSRSHFFAVFKAEVGMTFNEYVTSQRLQHACRLLASTNITITDIAYDSGFNSYSHFCATFRKKLGLTPTAFRNGNRDYSDCASDFRF